ncbi:hypothetical protein [Actinomadura citrea]|uniref:Uncharacterized protein n=1 Tax=Actinomadura citrea TaxID=46158 RepID=A0A7Y9GEX4_9ACTN|nr:hypothetical protein [Actinomadura citrea]NYE15241.1 hypothetical protein [Actinomadura citrea]GGT94388.1 hypothetical protein GCM10010177_61970 [Actinomadura citrea]
MGVDNPPGGPGKGPETPDKPTPPRTDDQPRADAPGTSGTPRIDSYKAAGQPVPGRPEAGTEQRGDREAQSNGSSTDSSSTGPAGEKPRTPGDPPSEAEPKTEKESETGKTEVDSRPDEDRDHDNGGTEAEKPGQAKTEDPRQDEGQRGTNDRESKTDQAEPGKAEGQDGSKDNGTTADAPASSEQPSTRPAEAPQFPPDSRRASLAAARESQLETAEERRAIFQDAQTTNGPGEGTAGESRDSGAPPQSENAGSDERGPEAQPPGTETPPGTIGDGDMSSGSDRSGNGEGSGGRDQPAPATPEAEAEPPAQETPRPQNQEHEPLVPQDSSDAGDDSGDPPAEPPADGSPPADDRTRDAKDGTLPGPEVGQPTEPAAETGREASSVGPETTDQGTEPPEPKADDGTTGNETDAPKPGDETTPPPEGTGENATPPEARGEQTDAHSRNAEGDGAESDPEDSDESKPEVRPNPIISDVYTDGQGQVRVEPRYGREQTDEPGSDPTRSVPETTEPTGLPTREDLDPVGARGGEAGRGELRRVEDDGASRDYQENDPEKPSRLRDMTRLMFTKADDLKDSADKLVEPGQKHLERVKPTGQSCVARTNPDHVKSVDAKVQVGDITLGIIGTTVMAIGAGRYSITMARKLIRR